MPPIPELKVLHACLHECMITALPSFLSQTIMTETVEFFGIGIVVWIAEYCGIGSKDVVSGMYVQTIGESEGFCGQPSQCIWPCSSCLFSPRSAPEKNSLRGNHACGHRVTALALCHKTVQFFYCLKCLLPCSSLHTPSDTCSLPRAAVHYTPLKLKVRRDSEPQPTAHVSDEAK